MTAQEELEMHALAEKLCDLTNGTGWQAMRYGAIGQDRLEPLLRHRT